MDTFSDSRNTAAGANQSGNWLQRPIWVILHRGEVTLHGSGARPTRVLEPSDVYLLANLASSAQKDRANLFQADESDFLVDLVEQGLIGDEQSSHWLTQPKPSDTNTCAESTGETVSSAGKHKPLILISPVILKLSPAGFEHLDHDGQVLASLLPRELVAAAAAFGGRPAGHRVALAAQQERLGDEALSDEEFGMLVARLRNAGLLLIAKAESGEVLFKSRSERIAERAWGELNHRNEATDRFLAEEREREADRVKAGSATRVSVIPVSPQGFPLLSLGTVLSTAFAHNDGAAAAHFHLLPDWTNRILSDLTADDPPSIFLYSNYIWTTRMNQAHSDQVKAINPHSLVIHGGPDVPKYEDDLKAYFTANHSIDIAVLGEGEATFAELLPALIGLVGDGQPDLSRLHDVAGIAYRRGDGFVRTADRDRIKDVNEIPSPYLTGLFDSVGNAGLPIGVVETNRGCPYGCTFCDWGSATLSRIRKFSLDRVFAELEWCAQHKTNGIYLADANFGIFPRDVEIAEKVIELKERYGYPKVFETNYAKNSVKYLGQIVRLLSAGGVLSSGILSLQSMDKNTLDTIRRSNIKLEQYENLAREFRNEGLPLNVDIMMGLPGATTESFWADLQQCVDRELRARVFPTQLLVNSPMNEPEYREVNQVVTANPISASWGKEGKEGENLAIVVSTSSFTRADYNEMTRMRTLFVLLENFGILRLTSRFVFQASGVRELDFYRDLLDSAQRNPSRWPTIAFTLETLPDILLPPGSWRHFIDEIREYLVEVLGIEDDSALATIMTVQHALLPARDRVFPSQLKLQHDVAAWHQSRFAAKDEGHLLDWPKIVPPLKEFGPTTFTVDDPQRICVLGFGSPLFYDADSDWELGSPIARPMTGRQEHI